MDGYMGGWMDGWMDEYDGQMHGWMNEQMDAWKDGQTSTYSLHIHVHTSIYIVDRACSSLPLILQYYYNYI